jgi:hypothetical protein
VVGVDAGDLDAGRESEGLGEGRGAGAADLVASDDKNSGGGLEGADGFLGRGRNLDGGEFFDAEVLKGRDGGDGLRLSVDGPRGEQDESQEQEWGERSQGAVQGSILPARYWRSRV